MEHCPACFNGQGPFEVIKRAKEETDPEILAEYGGGDQWPLYVSYNNGENAANGMRMCEIVSNPTTPSPSTLREGIAQL